MSSHIGHSHEHSHASAAPAGGFPISQIAIVVRDIDEALERYNRALGWGPWNVYEHKPPALHHTFLHGKPTEFTMIGAETHVGPIVVELLQPVEGPSIYKEWLDAHGEGLHHIAVMRPTPAGSARRSTSITWTPSRCSKSYSSQAPGTRWI